MRTYLLVAVLRREHEGSVARVPLVLDVRLSLEQGAGHLLVIL